MSPSMQSAASRITIFAGHYGSGKTNIALNFARSLRRGGDDVAVADLDIVNPYFRTKDSESRLAAEGIRLVVSDYANSNVDFPALPKEAYALFSDRSVRVVVDLGGDDRGALALGRYVDDIRAGNDFGMLGVVNMNRPLTSSVEDAVGVLREIEEASKLPFTGIVNNTNLGAETRAEDVLESVAPVEAVAAAMGLEVEMTCVASRLAGELEGKIANLFALEIQKLCYQLD